MIRKTILKTNWSGRFVCESLSDRLYWKVIVVCVNRFAGPTVCCGCTQPFGANGTWGAMGATRLLPWRQTSNVVRNVSTARLVCLFDFFFIFTARPVNRTRKQSPSIALSTHVPTLCLRSLCPTEEICHLFTRLTKICTLTFHVC